MKRLFFTFISASALLVAASSCSDLSGIEGRLDSVEGRVTALETQIGGINDNIKALQTLAGGATINSVTEKDGVYTIVLSDGKTLTLNQGSISAAKAPIMSIDADGYWKVDYQDGKGEQFVLSGGEKVKACGSDGVTPQFGVDASGYWTVSYDGGKTFAQVKDAAGNPVKATPESGAPVQADSYFNSVTYADGVLKLVLKNGTELSVPVISNFLFSIKAEGEQSFTSGETKEFEVESKGVVSTMITAPQGWKAQLSDTKLSITAPVATKAILADTDTDVAVLAVSAQGFSVISKVSVKLSTDTPVVEDEKDLYKLWEDGKDVTIAGKTYNKATTTGTLLTAEAAGTDIKASIHQKSGVFFLEAADGAGFTSETIVEINGDVVLVSRYNDKPVTWAPTVCLKFKAGSLAISNVIFDMKGIDKSNGNNGYLINNANSSENLKHLLIDNCRFTNILMPILYMSNAATAITELSITNSSFQSVATSNFTLFNLYKVAKLEDFHTVVFDNNVVYSEKNNNVQIFNVDPALAHDGKEWNTTFSINNNIIYNLPSNNGYARFYQLASFKMNKNVFYADPSIKKASYCVILYSDNQTVDALDVTDNLAFGLYDGTPGDETDPAINWTIAHSNSKVKPEVNKIAKLTETPFETANPTTGTFKLKSEYASYGPQTK